MFLQLIIKDSNEISFDILHSIYFFLIDETVYLRQCCFNIADNITNNTINCYKHSYILFYKVFKLLEFPSGSVVRIPCFHCWWCGFNPWSEVKTLQAMQHDQNKVLKLPVCLKKKKKKNLGFLYSVVNLLSVLYIFWIKVICKMHVYGMFSPNSGLHFHFPNNVRKLFILMMPTYKLFMAHAFILKIFNLCYFQVHNDLLMFSSRNVLASALFML